MLLLVGNFTQTTVRRTRPCSASCPALDVGNGPLCRLYFEGRRGRGRLRLRLGFRRVPKHRLPGVELWHRHRRGRQFWRWFRLRLRPRLRLWLWPWLRLLLSFYFFFLLLLLLLLLVFRIAMQGNSTSHTL